MAKINEKEQTMINKKNSGKGKTIYEKLIFIPIIILLAIVPLVVRLKIQSVTGQDTSYTLGSNFADTFSYWKSNIVFLVGILTVFMGFFFFRRKDCKSSKGIKIAVVALVLFIVFSLLSAIMSDHKGLVWWGQYGQRQGFIILFSYAAIFLYSMHFYKEKEDISYILISLGVMVIIEFILMFSQFIDKDIIFSDFVKSIIIPSEYGNIGDTMTWDIKGKAYGTLYNPNYVGSFVALLVPIFMAVVFKAKDFKEKIFWSFVAFSLLFCLFASGSRAGMVGLGASLVVGLILFGKLLLQNPKVIAIVIAATLVAGFGLNVLTKGLVVERVGSILGDVVSIFDKSERDILENSIIKDIYVRDNRLTIDLGSEKLNLVLTSTDEVMLTDANGKEIKYQRENEVYIVPEKIFPLDIRFQEGELAKGDSVQKLYVLEIDNKQWFMVTRDEENLISLDKYGNPITIETAESIGFSGKEHIGSNRGYIWSRSLPVLMDNFLFGVGPDAFVAEFPHGDIVMRNAVYGYGTVIADKPHNLYLQIGINQGIIALGAFLVLNGVYIVNSFKVYFKKKGYTFHDMFGIGIMLGIVGYLGAGMFNDSVVSVAPLYWCLLGIGFATNYINEKEVIKE